MSDPPTPDVNSTWTDVWFRAAWGLTLQTLLQIRLVGWLPDFPLYDLFAWLTVLLAICGMIAARFRLERAGAIFVLASLVQGVAQSAPAPWGSRATVDVAFGIMLAAGAVQVLRADAVSSIPLKLMSVWLLGEAIAARLGVFYAPSYGESTSLAAYRYVLLLSAISAVVWMASAVVRRRLLPAGIIAFLVLPIVCGAYAFLVPNPDEAQAVLAWLTMFRFFLGFSDDIGNSRPFGNSLFPTRRSVDA